MKNRDIIIVGLQDWDTPIGSNCKNIALEFARDNRVLYVNYPLDMITFLREKGNPNIRKRIDAITSRKAQISEVQKNLWSFYPANLISSINWIASPSLFNYLNKRNNRSFAKEIKRAAKRLGFSNYILFNDNDIFRSFYLKEELQPDMSVYYIRDYLLSVPYWQKHGTRLEPELIQKSDVVVTNSVYLRNYAARYNSNSHYVGQGCETDLFDPEKQYPVPEELKSVRKPVVGYIGMLASLRLDIQLLISLAEKMPDISFVFVGPEDNDFASSRLHNISNVHFLGSREVSRLPEYVAHFDICINPQIVNDVTIGNYPRKVDEYLAMGKPVVATRTEAMDVFNDHTYLALGADDYAEKITRALQENSEALKKQRSQFAREHTWENSVAAIYNAMNIKGGRQ